MRIMLVCGASVLGSNGGTQAKHGQLMTPNLVLELLPK